MDFAGGVEYVIGMTIPRQEYAVEISLGSTGGNVPPVVFQFNLPQVGEEVDHGALELARMDAVVRGDEGIAHIINRVLYKLVELLVIMHKVVWIVEMDGGALLKVAIVRLEIGGLVGNLLSLSFGSANTNGFAG